MKNTEDVALNVFYHLTRAKRGVEWAKLSVLSFGNSGRDFGKHSSTGYTESSRGMHGPWGGPSAVFPLCSRKILLIAHTGMFVMGHLNVYKRVTSSRLVQDLCSNTDPTYAVSSDF